MSSSRYPTNKKTQDFSWLHKALPRWSVTSVTDIDRDWLTLTTTRNKTSTTFKLTATFPKAFEGIS